MNPIALGGTKSDTEGRFGVDATASNCAHEIEGGWFPNWMGPKQKRLVYFNRDRIILER
jgi:hypothetical protein